MTVPVSIPAELLESSSHIERNMGITTRIDRTMHDYVQNLLYIYIHIKITIYIYIYMIIICLLLYTMYTWSPWAGHFSKTAAGAKRVQIASEARRRSCPALGPGK